VSGEFDLESVYKLQLCRMNIRTIENLENCTNLQELNLSGNDIERIEGLEKLHNLRKITLTTNKITSLAGLDKCESLEHILIQENNIGNIGEFTQLLGLKNLKSLYFKNIDGTQRNPLCEHPSYRSSIVRQLTQLTILDGERLKHANTVYSDAPAAPSSAPAVAIPESKPWLGDFSWDDDGGSGVCVSVCVCVCVLCV
jgi:Leucine-rich repeat (LRR) protein